MSVLIGMCCDNFNSSVEGCELLRQRMSDSFITFGGDLRHKDLSLQVRDSVFACRPPFELRASHILKPRRDEDLCFYLQCDCSLSYHGALAPVSYVRSFSPNLPTVEVVTAHGEHALHTCIMNTRTQKSSVCWLVSVA